jgi:two-component system C4-dicarboxylate transport sensor histidine kinase DctB
VVEQALFLFQLRIRHELVRVDNRCEANSWLAWCDANRLEQVIVNLVGNALDAMRDAPQKTLTIEAEQLDLGHVAMVVLRVRDSGKGLSPTDLARLFEPFYTTKPGGAGLGLGLAICRDLVAEFQGELTARNHPEGGACFTLLVPVAPAAGITIDEPSR